MGIIVCALTASPNESVEWSHCEKIDEQMIGKIVEKELGAVVAHGAAGMAAVKDPAEVLCELIRRVDDTW